VKILIQRVKKASVKIKEKITGEIKKGILIFLGVAPFDTKKEISFFVKKIIKLRIFSDENQKMNLSLKDVKGEILVVSQFTLYADLLKGNRPSFINAAKPDFAKNIYDEFIEEIKKEGVKVEQGIFGEKMEVFLINDGPVTFIL